MRGGIGRYRLKSIQIRNMGNIKIRRKSLQRDIMGTHFEDRNYFHTLFSSLSLKSNHLFLVKCSGLIFPAGCPNSSHQCYVPAARKQATVHKMCLPFTPFSCTVTHDFIWVVQKPQILTLLERLRFSEELRDRLQLNIGDSYCLAATIASRISAPKAHVTAISARI